MFKLPLKRLLHSYSFRIALMYVMFFLLSTFILFSFIYLSSTRSITDQLIENIETDKIVFSDRFALSELNGLIRLVNSRAQSQGENAAFSIINQDQQIIAGNLGVWPAQLLPTQDKSGQIKFKRQHNNDIEHVYRGIIIGLTDGHKLLLARSYGRIDETQKNLITTFSWAAIITLLLGLMGGYILSTRAVKRISSINRLCRNIIEGNISQRLNINQAQDDLDDLSLNINSMLDKIEMLMQEIVQVSDNIAHDMRTPLSHLRLDLESLQSHPNLDSHTLTRLEASVEATDNIISTFNSLLRISKIEAKNTQATFEILNFTKLAEDVIELYQPVLEEKKQILKVDLMPDIQVLGDKDLLFQALANLLDNASKYSPKSKQIYFSVNSERNIINLAICNESPNVTKSEISKLTQRFYRADTARSTPGDGLGLSLVNAILHIHQAHLKLSYQQAGSRFCANIFFNAPPSNH